MRWAECLRRARLETREAMDAADALMQVFTKEYGESRRGGVTIAFKPERVTTPALVLSELLGGGERLQRVGADPATRRLSDQDLVELLKRPLCVGPARRVILDHLGHHHRRSFTDQWEFVRFAEDQKLDLDFTRPPQRP